MTSVAFNGVAFPSSLEAWMYDGSPTTQSIEFNLDHACTKFRGTFGISDDSESGSQASVQASADGTSWYDHTFAVGQSQPNSFTFATPPLKVRFDTTSLVAGLDGLGLSGRRRCTARSRHMSGAPSWGRRPAMRSGHEG